MRTKRICLLMALVATTGITQAQKNMHKVFGTDEKIIKGATKIWVYEIDPIPVMSVDQIQGENYVYDYRLMKTVTTTKKKAAGLIAAVLDSTNYLYGVNKKCPFMGTYAVQFRKGKKSVTIILSAEPCDKAIIFCPGSVIDKKHIDLKDKNTILPAIQYLLNPIVIEDKK